MMDEIWRLKVHAFLHDPPEKALILFEGGHAARGKELAEGLVGPAPDGAEEAIKAADQMASAADREALLSGAPDLDWNKRPVLRHSLSGDEIDLGRWGWIDIDSEVARHQVDQAVEKLKGFPPEQVFWGLWRLLPSYLRESVADGKRIGALWDYFPAETRMPDHSIWDHQRLVSALAPILWQKQTPALLLVAFGPVQGFIATARRTADLWAGSFILSWLASRAIVPLLQAYGPDAVLFPALLRQPIVDQWMEEGPLKLTLPDKQPLGQVASLPNRFLAVVPKEGAKNIAKLCVEAVREEWKRLGEAACESFAQISGVEAGKIAKFFERQLPPHLETHWAAFPWPRDTKECQNLLENRIGQDSIPRLDAVDMGDVRQYRPNAGALYGAVYRAADLTLGATKASRLFESKEEPGLKCSLCGDREVVHPYEDPALGTCKGWWGKLSENNPARIRRGEGLCAVCLAKRLSTEIFHKEIGLEHDVPSTSEIAAAPFKLAVLRKLSQLEEPLQKFVNLAHDRGLDNAWTLAKIWKVAAEIPDADGELARWFARIDGEVFWAMGETEDQPEDRRISRDVAKAAQDLVRAAADFGISRPFQYLGILHMDGDDMGKWLGGDRMVPLDNILHPETNNWLEGCIGTGHQLWKKRKPMSPATHAAVSRACVAFSRRVIPALTRERLAYLIYAGGDDLLALVALDDALDLARDIRLAFGGHMEIQDGKEVKAFDVGRGFYRAGGEAIETFGKLAGLSGGLVIFHHKYPLQVAVEESRRVEERAKQIEGKDTLAVRVIRRGGQPTFCRLRWTNKDRTADGIRDLMTISETFRDHFLSPRFFPALSTLLVSPEAKSLPSKAIDLLVKRELERHWDNDEVKKKGVSDDDIMTHVYDSICELGRQTPSQSDWLGSLETAVFLARGGR